MTPEPVAPSDMPDPPAERRLGATPRLRQMSTVYRVFHYGIVPVVNRFWGRLTVEGREYLPDEGPLLLVSNHVSNLDSYLVGMFARGRVVNYMARADGMAHPWLGRYWQQLGAIPADGEGLREALRILRAGGAVGVFPEGVIAPALVRGIPGSALLAVRSGAMVVPAAVWGPELVGPWSWINPPVVHLRYGPPRVIKRERGVDLQSVTDALMREIAAMLPPSYRGIYG